MKRQIISAFSMLLVACGGTNNYYTQEESDTSFEFMYGTYINHGLADATCNSLQESTIKILPYLAGVRVRLNNKSPIDLLCNDKLCVGELEIEMHVEGFALVRDRNDCVTLFVHSEVQE